MGICCQGQQATKHICWRAALCMASIRPQEAGAFRFLGSSPPNSVFLGRGTWQSFRLVHTKPAIQHLSSMSGQTTPGARSPAIFETSRSAVLRSKRAGECPRKRHQGESTPCVPQLSRNPTSAPLQSSGRGPGWLKRCGVPSRMEAQSPQPYTVSQCV